jgi:hypothetical protein
MLCVNCPNTSVWAATHPVVADTYFCDACLPQQYRGKAWVTEIPEVLPPEVLPFEVLPFEVLPFEEKPTK